MRFRQISDPAPQKHPRILFFTNFKKYENNHRSYDQYFFRATTIVNLVSKMTPPPLVQYWGPSIPRFRCLGAMKNKIFMEVLMFVESNQIRTTQNNFQRCRSTFSIHTTAVGCFYRLINTFGFTFTSIAIFGRHIIYVSGSCISKPIPLYKISWR